MKHSKYIYPFLLVALTGTVSCKKKLDNISDNRLQQQPLTGSSSRLINLAGANELQIAGQKLTSFMAADKEGGYGPDQTRSTVYFPETGRMGATFTVPLQLVDAQGMIRDILFSSSSSKVIAPPSRPFTAVDDYNHPMDYYFAWFAPNKGGYQDSLFAIPREVSPSSNPEHFKIRLLNLGTTPDRFHTGNMSLTWADGTAIAGLENIAPGSYSDYIEIPFGSYQFKVLDADGKEVPAKGSLEMVNNVLNPETGTMMSATADGDAGVGGFSDTWLTYAPLKTYQPGGIYTIAVGAMSGYGIPTGGPGETVATLTNSFQVIADNKESTNITYSRMQAVNVLAGKEISWQVDGKPLGETLAFATQTTYSRYIAGTHHVKALDKQGATLAETDRQLMPGDNITAWLYATRDGKPAISFSANNLSGKYYTGASGNDGSYATAQDLNPWWIRFMNFCADEEEVTFTKANGQHFTTSTTSQAYAHIQLGKAAEVNEYVRLRANEPVSILAYTSKPGVFPGNWMTEVTPVAANRFIANPALYKTAKKPNAEPGIYTVALVGNTAAGEKPSMIIIKHNK
ncbi:hypothetical protein SAMN05421788_10679 [Filimonas lacunae]|uniref:DUF4397 domain-containing protein n=1 Tax=Filimonas lacunae TaxID=477680 RepID=A0A173MER3_9BACT|nr:hypothetical protein [Filimonas lacunae]BAV06007.1 hypothetical protein FLA_2022 [Filimonas lacunae]SIT24156.1 hypothetical protein SAMN05421788_10679 [Filimonas lacunae]